MLRSYRVRFAPCSSHCSLANTRLFDIYPMLITNQLTCLDNVILPLCSLPPTSSRTPPPGWSRCSISLRRPGPGSRTPAQQSAVSSYGTSSSPYLDADTFVAPAPEAQTGDRLALKQVSPSHLSNCQKSISTSKFDSFSPKFSLHFHHQNTLNLIHSFGV